MRSLADCYSRGYSYNAPGTIFSNIWEIWHKMPRLGWTEKQRIQGSKMWREGALVADIAKTIGKNSHAIYGYARDNRELFPKRTRGARKKKRDPEPIPPAEPVPLEEIKTSGSRTARSLKNSILVYEHLEKDALRKQQKNAAAEFRRAADITRRELEILEELDNG